MSALMHLTFFLYSIEKVKALSMILHCADISHAAKEWKLHSKWTQLLMQEFFRQVSFVLIFQKLLLINSCAQMLHCYTFGFHHVQSLKQNLNSDTISYNILVRPFIIYELIASREDTN